jgi:hypothetical protein
MVTGEPRRGQKRTSLRRGMWTLFYYLIFLLYYLIFLPAAAAVRHAGDIPHRGPDPDRASYFRILPPRR